MQQMRRSVVAHGGFAHLGVHHGVDFVAHANRSLGEHLMGPHALDRVVASFYLCDYSVVIAGVERSTIPDLSTGLSIERSMVENDLACFTCFEFMCALPVVDDGQDFAVFGARLPISFKFGLRKLLVYGICGLLGCSLPRGLRQFALLLHRTIE